MPAEEQRLARFRDKVALVTGAGGSIGSAIATAFAAEGAVVIACDIAADPCRRTVDAIHSAGGRAHVAVCDITDTAAVNAMVQALVAEHGRIDVLVNNAGGIDDARIQQMTDQQWDRIVDLVLKGSFLLGRACTETLKQSRGRIVNIGSMSYKGNIGQANYSAAKAGLVGLTKSMGLELARHGVTVNLVAPGLVAGPSLDALGEEVAARLAKVIPIGRPATGAEIAHAVMFFADEASASITRQVLHVSGGHEGF
jgi:3-oxoacyl-[acyl-carrier protein] reductase